MNPNASTQITGKPLNRRDGRAKVTGAAKYSADWEENGCAHAVLFQSTIAAGEVDKIELTAARAVPGVIEIMTHENVPHIHLFNPMFKMYLGDPELPLQSKKISYYGQYLGVVIAESIEAAEQAARLIDVRYKVGNAQLGFEAKKVKDAKIIKKDPMLGDLTVSKGDLRKARAKANTEIHQNYFIPNENHHPLEPAATLAKWDGDELLIYDATQGVANTANVVGAALDAKQKTHVITKFVGGGFGCKGSIWPHTLIAALAAKTVKRPVKLSLSRAQMSSGVGYRAMTDQEVSLSATEDGKLTAIQHKVTNPTAMNKDYPEQAGALFKLLYDAEAIETTQQVVELNHPHPTFMRAPGEAPGSFALESAIDELAHRLQIDPITLRMKNDSVKDPIKEIPYSSKSLKECYAQGAERMGWKNRNVAPQSLREGDWWVGYGVATASYPVHFFPSSASIELFENGKVKVLCASQDIGTGTYTSMHQLAVDALTLPPEDVDFDLGDSHYPPGNLAGGSSTVSSLGWAIHASAEKLFAELKKLAASQKDSVLFGAKPDTIRMENGCASLISSPDQSESFVQILKRAKKASLKVDGELDLAKQKKNEENYSMHSHGAQFAKVRVHATTGEVRLEKMVGAFAAGKIVNPKTARSQYMGGMIFGIGMGLTEHNFVDERTGKFVLRDFAEYHIPVNLDVPDLDIIMVEEKDTIVNPAGTKGIGEIGTVGAAAAIANAVFNATGIRVRELPITPDKLVVAMVQR